MPPCRVLEHAARGTLHALLARGFLPHRHGPLFLWLALDLARALRHLHESKPSPLLHRDVRAENVLVTRDWRAKLTGFSFTRAQAERQLVQTQVGTPFSYQDYLMSCCPYIEVRRALISYQDYKMLLLTLAGGHAVLDSARDLRERAVQLQGGCLLLCTARTVNAIGGITPRYHRAKRT